MDEGGRWRWGQRPRLRQQWPVGSNATAADHGQITMTREHAGSGATMRPTSTERIGLSDAVAGQGEVGDAASSLSGIPPPRGFCLPR